MTQQPHWRKNRPISLPAEDNARLERLKLKAERFTTQPTYSLIVRAALRELDKLPDWKFRAALEALPPTRYGPEPKNPRPVLSEEEREALLLKLGLK
jgi:hypothetical protein